MCIDGNSFVIVVCWLQLFTILSQTNCNVDVIINLTLFICKLIADRLHHTVNKLHQDTKVTFKTATDCKWLQTSHSF